MATSEQYAQWIVDNADKRGTPDFNTVAEAYKASKERFSVSEPAVAPTEAAPVEQPKERTFGEAATDLAAGLTSGIGSVIQLPGQLYGLATGDFEDSGILGFGKRIAKSGEDMKSEALKQKEKQRSQKIQDAEDKGQWEAFKTAFGETVKDPALFASFIAEQAPQMLVPFGGAKVIKGLTLAKGLRAGLPAIEATQAAGTAGTRAAIGAGAVQQGADIGAGAYEELYKALVLKGTPEEEAKSQSLNLARAAGASGAVISLLAQRLPGAKTLEESFAGVPGTSGRLLGAAKGALGETASEIVEETGGKFAQNVAMRQVNPEQQLAQGLGATAGMAAIGGGTLGGVAGALRTPQADQATQPPPLPPEAPQIDPDKYSAVIKGLTAAIPDSGLTDSSKLGEIFKASGIENEAEVSAYLNQAITSGEIVANSNPVFNVTDANGKVLFNTVEKAVADKAAERLNTEDAGTATVEEALTTKFTKPTGMPQGIEVRAGQFKQDMFNISRGDTILNPEPLSAEEVGQKAYRLSKITAGSTEANTKEIEVLQKKIDTNNTSKEKLEAAGEALSPEYATLSAQVNENNALIQAQIEEVKQKGSAFSGDISITPAKQSDEGFTLFKQGKPAEYFKTEEDLNQALAAEPTAGLTGSTAGPTSASPDVFNEAREALREKLLPFLKQVGLENTGLRIMDSIENGQGSSDGVYAESLISISLQAANPMGTLRHETIHALKELESFSKQEWSLLESYAKKQWVNQFLRQRKIGDSNYYDTYKKIYLETHPSIAGFDEYIIEEAIADAFKYFNATKPPANIIGNIYRKVKAFLEGMGNQLSGLGFQTADDVFKRVEAGQMKPTQQAGTGAAPRYSIFQRTPENIDEQSTAKPKALVKPKLIEGEDVVRDPIAQFLIINGSDIRNVPKHLESVVNVINQYNAFPVGANADETIRNMHETIVSNLTWLYRLLPANLRERAKLWYDGANRIANDVSKKYGYTVNQVAGVYAALSPQKDWFMNVSLGDRVISIMRERGDERISLAMKAWVDSYVNASKTKKDKVSRVEMQEKFRLIGDKTLNEMSDKEAAIFVRVFDETYNPRKYRIVTPEGGFLGFVTNNQNDEVDPEGDSDVPEGDVAWNGYGSIAKAVSIIRNGSKENISTQLGAMHKVRNFYNNILVPNSAAGHVTIDTHAVAAAFFKALSGASAEVMHNFGGAASKGLPSPGRSTLTGASGTYGFIADAYRDAAARIAKEDNIKLLPRELQSITWEAIRAIFPAAWKRENMSRVEDIYNRAKSGEITLAQAKSETEALATTKGRLINPFAWESETSGDFVSNGGKSFDQDIHPDVAKRKARVMPPHTLKDTLRVNITAATDKIPGIDVLFKEANKGSLAATKVIQDAAQYNLEHLLSDIPEARISYDRGIGLYGEKREPTLGLNINFPSDSRNVVLAALNKFSNNFMQERFDVREATNEKIGSVFSDNSYATLAHRFTLNTALSTEEVQKIIKNSGLSGITFGINKNKENYIEAYYVAKNIEELNDESERNSYTRAIAGIREGLGKSAARVDEVVQRLWAYGRIGGARFGVTVDAGNLGSHVPASGSKDIKTAKVIAEYLYANNLEKVTEKERKQFPKSLKLVTQEKEISFKQHNLQRMIQKFFDLLPVENLNNRMVMKAYESLAKEVKRQYSVLPIKVEAKFERDNDGNIKLDKNNNPIPTAPYGETKNISMNMRKDIMDNNRLYIYPTMAESFGPKGYDFSKHPLLKQSGYTDSNGYPMTYNDLLRAVHDYYAHGPKSASFGALGEEAAWKNHMSMIKDPLARWALTMETRAQNSWINFRDEVQHLSLPERGFSEQKASLLPVEFALTGDAAIDKPMHEFIKGLSSSQRLGSKPTNPNEFMKLMGEHNKNKVSGGYPSSLITKGKTPEKGRKFSLQDTVYIDGVNRPTTDSRGRPIFNTLEGIKNFWRGFGDSAIVDKDGKPMLMYHSTTPPEESEDIFSKFRSSDDGKLGKGIYTTSIEKYAESFAPSGAVMPIYISMSNPFYINLSSKVIEGKSARTILREQISGSSKDTFDKNYFRLDSEGTKEINNALNTEIQSITNGKRLMDISGIAIQRALKKSGYDGIAVKDSEGNFVEVNSFDSAQIKSATGNRGTFSPKSKDIRYSITSPVWYSELSRQIDKLPQKEMTAAEWKALLVNPAETKSRGVRGPDNKVIPGKFITTEVPATSKLPGVKLKEIDDTEILEWLDVAGTSFEVDDYIDVLDEKYGVRKEEGITYPGWKESDLTADELRTLKSAQSGGRKNTKISTAQVQQFLADGGSKIEFQDVVLGGAPKKKFKLTNVDEARRFAEQFTNLVNLSDEDVVRTANEWADVEVDNPTQFNDYQLPGGKNYREAFVTVPFSGESKADAIARRDATWTRISERIDFPRGEHQLYQVKWARENVPALFREWVSASDNANEFKVAGNWKDGHGSYDGIDNPVVRIRFNDRTDVDGNKVLFLEELQPPNNPEFEKMPKSLQDRWLAIGLKRMIRHAAEGDYDKIAWTTGEQQVERYSNALREKVGSIEWEKTPEGVHIKGYKDTPKLTRDSDMSDYIIDNVNRALENNDRLGFDRLNQARAALLDDGAGTEWKNRWDISDSSAYDIAAMQAYIDARFKTRELVADTTYKETDLTQAIGKLMADRIRNDPSQTGTIEGEDLSIDSVGVKKLYDVGVPALANKILKEMGGGKVGEVGIDIPMTRVQINEAQINDPRFLVNYVNKQPSFDITPPLREKAMSGVPRYSISDTPAFKRWFGDSKVVDKDGKPLVVYHGTATGGFTTFSNDGGFWFTESLDHAASYAGTDRDVQEYFDGAMDETDIQDSGVVYSAYLKSEKLLVVDFKRRDWKGRPALEDDIDNDLEVLPLNAQSIAEKAREDGYDGVLFKNIVDPGPAENVWGYELSPENQYVVFDKRQIKSATGNRGTFDPYNPDIRYSLRDDKEDKVTMWYDRYERSWVVQSLDWEGNQIGDVTYVYTRQEAEQERKLREAAGGATLKPDIRYSLRDDFITKFGQADLTNLNSKTHVREEEGFAKRLAAAISPDSRVKLRAQIVNRLEAIERQTMKVSVDPRYGGSNELLADVSATAAALQSQRASGIAAESFKRGVPVYAKGFTSVSDLNGTVKGLIPIFQPLLNKYKDPMIWQIFQFYSATRRGGRFIQEGREKLFTAADIQKGKDYGVAYPEFDAVFKDYQKYNEGLVKFQVDTGVLTPELGRKWMMYSDYIPFYRQLNGEETLGPKLFQNFSGVKPTPILKGSDVKIADFLETIILNSRSAIENGMKNVASQRIARDAMRTNSPNMQDMARKLAHWEKDAADVIHVRENGVDVRYKVADILLVEAMKGLGTTEMGSMLKFLSYPTRVLRDLVTKDPGFMLANLFRDSAQAYVTSGVNMIPIIDTFKQAAKILANQSPEAKALMAAGIGGGYEFSGDVKASAKAVSAALNDKAGIKTGWQKALWPVSKVWSALEAGTTASDLATRSEIYARVMKSTNGNEAEAVYQALEVMNFGRMGSSPVIQVVSALVPFFNARVQGLDVLYRAGTGRLASASAKTQQKLFARRAMYIMGMSIAYWMLARDTDEWKRASKETRDNNWIIGSVKVPIPFEIGTIFKVLPERILEYTFGNDTGADLADSAFRNIASTLKMVPVPQAVLPLVEAYWLDYSFFTGNGVVGRGMEKLDPQFQLREGTSLVAKKMGDITGMSPVKIDHVLQGYTGAMGMYAASAISAMIRTEDDGAKASMSLEQTPILKRFFASDKAGGSIDAFYEFKKKVDMVVATQDELQKRGNPEQYIEYMKTNGKLLGAKQIVSNIGDKLSEMRKLRNIVNFSKSMQPDQKRETLDNIRMAEIKLTESIQGIRAMVMQ